MTATKNPTPYMAYRFGLFLPGTSQFVGVSKITSDPSGASKLCLARAHMPNRPSLASLLEGHRDAQVVILQKLEKNTRKIEITWKAQTWAPLDLDASKSEVALERVILHDVEYGEPVDAYGEDIDLPEVWVTAQDPPKKVVRRNPVKLFSVPLADASPPERK